MRSLVVALVGAVALAVASTALAAPAAKKLNGTVGPGFTITLKDSTGKVVKKLKPGAYTIAISDKASTHNFHLTGPGLNKSTSVPSTGSATWKVTLKKGKYHYQCDPHAGSMNGSFTVT